jgi:hypothetical protein
VVLQGKCLFVDKCRFTTSRCGACSDGCLGRSKRRRKSRQRGKRRRRRFCKLRKGRSVPERRKHGGKGGGDEQPRRDAVVDVNVDVLDVVEVRLDDLEKDQVEDHRDQRYHRREGGNQACEEEPKAVATRGDEEGEKRDSAGDGMKDQNLGDDSDGGLGVVRNEGGEDRGEFVADRGGGARGGAVESFSG